MKIVNHVLQGAKFLKANASGGPLEPALIVLHDTAGRLEKGSSVNWLRSKGCKVSAHVVVELDGTVYVFGGRTVGPAPSLKLDTKTRVWSSSDWPPPRSCNCNKRLNSASANSSRTSPIVSLNKMPATSAN